MNELKIFNNHEFGAVRTVTENAKVLFCGSDVARALGYASPKDAIYAHCKGAVKRSTLTEGGEQEMSFIPESDIYRLIIKSKLPSAEKFEKWVFEDVLPSIRKNGGYISDQNNLSSEELLAKAVLLANNVIAEKDLKIKQMGNEIIGMNNVISELQPKANYVDTVLNSKGTVTVTQIAQDYGMSARALNNILKKERIQHKVNNQWVLYSKYIGSGYVQSITVDIKRANGMPDVTMHTEWTQKGRLFLYELLKSINIHPLIER